MGSGASLARGRVPSQRQILRIVPDELKEELERVGLGGDLMGALAELFVQIPGPADISPEPGCSGDPCKGGGGCNGGKRSVGGGASSSSAGGVARVNSDTASTLSDSHAFKASSKANENTSTSPASDPAFSDALEEGVREVMVRAIALLEEKRFEKRLVPRGPEWPAVRRLLEAVNVLWRQPKVTVEVAGEEVRVRGLSVVGHVLSKSLPSRS